MAKFAVGEIALFVKPTSKRNGKRVEIIGVGPFKIGEPDPFIPGMFILFDHDYAVKVEGEEIIGGLAVQEKNLRKLPPDSDSQGRTTSEDPGVTRLKKLLEQDATKKVAKETGKV